MNYEMGGTILSKTVKEKDLGVTMNANMKVSEQCRIAASKGNQVLGMIRRNIYIYNCILKSHQTIRKISARAPRTATKFAVKIGIDVSDTI